MKKPAAFAALILSLTLGGCGFTPMYGGGGVSSSLSRIETEAPEGRAGFLLRQALDDALARNPTLPSLYRLRIDLAQARVARGVRDNAADRYELTLTANYRLIEMSGDKTAYSGTQSAEVTTDTAAQPYAGIAAQADAEDRAASELARRIQLDLARWMSVKP